MIFGYGLMSSPELQIASLILWYNSICSLFRYSFSSHQISLNCSFLLIDLFRLAIYLGCAKVQPTYNSDVSSHHISLQLLLEDSLRPRADLNIFTMAHLLQQIPFTRYLLTIIPENALKSFHYKRLYPPDSNSPCSLLAAL